MIRLTRRHLRGRLAGRTTLEVERRRARDSPPYLGFMFQAALATFA